MLTEAKIYHELIIPWNREYTEDNSLLGYGAV
jgi:hypothetical protein